jgi:hypothetical protein
MRRQVNNDIRAGIIQHALDSFHLDQIILLQLGHKNICRTALAQFFDDKGAKKPGSPGYTYSLIAPETIVCHKRL